MSWQSYAEKSVLYFTLVLNVDQFFAVFFNCASGFLHLSNNQVKTEMSVATVITRMWSGDCDWYMTLPLYVNSFFFFTAVTMFHFCLRLQSGAVLASNSRGLFEEEIAPSLLEELRDSNSSSGDDSSGTDGMAVGEVIALECSDNEDFSVQSSEHPVHLMPNMHLLFVWRIRQTM
jgi:hypothetical protein